MHKHVLSRVFLIVKNASAHDYIGHKVAFCNRKNKLHYSFDSAFGNTLFVWRLQNTFIRITYIFYNATVKVKTFMR